MNEEQIDRFYSDLGRRISSARRAAGVTQLHLANVSGLTRSSVANVEAGRQRVPLHVLAAMAGALRVEPQALFSPGLLDDEPDAKVLTLALKAGDPESTRQFIEGCVGSVGLSVRWAS